MSVTCRVWPFKVEDQTDVLEVNGGVGIDEAERDGLRQASVDGCVIVVPEPFQASEDGRGVFARSERGIVVVETVLALELQHFFVQSNGFVIERVTGLVAAAPEVGDTPHVWIAAVVNGRGEPLLGGLAFVVHLLGGVLRGFRLTVSVEIMVLLDPIIQGQFHRDTNLVVDQGPNRLQVGRCLVSVFGRYGKGPFWRGAVHTEGT